MFSIVEGGVHSSVLLVLLAVSVQRGQKFDDVDLLGGLAGCLAPKRKPFQKQS